MISDPDEMYICVDIETAGPVPGDYSLLSIGACTLADPPATFYIELKPINDQLTAEASQVHQLSMARLEAQGIEPGQALLQFEAWLKTQLLANQQPVFVAFNAPFDWMFVDYYFFHYLGHNPFGHAALDIKALYMGFAGVPWSQTSWRFIDPNFVEPKNLTHHALQDALDQARLFKKLLTDLHGKNYITRRENTMKANDQPAPSAELARIIESAHRLGIELDEAEALQWVTAMASFESSNEISVDAETGVFGHQIVMLDFSPRDLAYFRQVGRLVEFDDQPGVVETALALSGSSAQSKIQTYPGDCDYFERVNILAPTRQQACQILSKIMRDKALSTLKGPTYQLLEVKFGSYPLDLLRDDRLIRKGTPISWLPDEIQAGQISASLPDGAPTRVSWDEVAADPGWCKLDWVIADPVRGQLSNASNMLDVTWEAPNGEITPLDGYLDPYFQEVYLEAASIPIFSKLSKHVSADALNDYVMQLEHEVNKYLTKDINYGKVAKRLYNIFRLTGRYEDAAFLRDLFDEPATMLYQVWSLIRTIDDACKPGAEITTDQLLAQADQLILAVIRVLEGDQEAEIVRLLLRLRDALSRQASGQALNAPAEAARAEVINLVNNFFYEKLTAVPTIKAYMDGLQTVG